jgi:hypothetical protein
LKNYFNRIIEDILPAITEAKSLIDFHDSSSVPNYLTAINDLKKTILMQICTFPVEITNSFFVAEYVLPQMLTTALMENDYVGVTFPSTKDFSDITDNHRFSSHHINLGLFVNYDTSLDYDEKLRDTFHIYTLDGTESYDYTVESVIAEIKSTIKDAITAKVDNNDYFFAATMAKIHFEYLENASLTGRKYFDTNSGKVELELYMKMLHRIKSSFTGITMA